MSTHAMPKKGMLLASAVAALCTGCASLPRDTELPHARPLGAEYKTIGRSPDAALTAASGVDMALTDAITIEQALALALMRSPELEAFFHAALAAQARFGQSKRLPNPKVKVGVSEVDRTGEGFDAADIELVIGQRLEWGGKRGWRARVAEPLRPVRAEADGRRILVSHGMPGAVSDYLMAKGFEVIPSCGGAVSVAPLIRGVRAGVRWSSNGGVGVSIRGRIGSLIAAFYHLLLE